MFSPAGFAQRKYLFPWKGTNVNHPTKAPTNAMGAISSVLKIIMRPEAGRQQVQSPDGVAISSYGAGNSSATVWVTNLTETPPTCQGVCHDTGSVIVNSVPQVIAEAAIYVFETKGLDAAVAMLSHLGYMDQYTTNFSFIDKKLSPAGTVVDAYSGVVKRHDRDIMPVWREADGAHYVLNNQVPHLIQLGILLRDYRNSDGSQIKPDQVPLAQYDEVDEPAVV